MTSASTNFFPTVLDVMAAVFIVVIGLVALWAVVAYVVDVTQTSQAVRRDCPVIGRFRYFLEHLGEFFRQYFFAMDREELSFNAGPNVLGSTSEWVGKRLQTYVLSLTACSAKGP